MWSVAAPPASTPRPSSTTCTRERSGPPAVLVGASSLSKALVDQSALRRSLTTTDNPQPCLWSFPEGGLAHTAYQDTEGPGRGLSSHLGLLAERVVMAYSNPSAQVSTLLGQFAQPAALQRDLNDG